MPRTKSTKTKSTNVTTTERKAKSKGTRKERAPRRHPLSQFTYVDDVPIELYPSPVRSFSNTFTKKKEIDQAIKMEDKIQEHLYHFNTPCIGEAKKRFPLGECEEHVFDRYMSATMPGHLYKRVVEYTPFHYREGKAAVRSIIYDFQYPHFPSFFDDDNGWALHYTTVDQTEKAATLRSLGGKIPKFFEQAPYCCIAKKVTVSYDTRTGVYYVAFSHWVQKKCEVTQCNSSNVPEKVEAWVDSF